MKIKIRAITKHHPKNHISSVELDQITNQKIGSTEKTTGVKFRYQAAPNESICQLGAEALKKCLATSSLKPSDLDFLIAAGASFDYPIPYNAVVIKSLITDDHVNFGCLDINSTCLSFLNAMDIAHLYLQSKKYKRIAIVCSEISSRGLRPEDKKEFGLFGDASIALILESSDTEGYIPTFSKFVNFPSGVMFASIGIGGAIDRGISADKTHPGYYFQMQGKNLIRLTTKHLTDFIKHLEEHENCKLKHFDRIITHQTSKFGNEYIARNYGLNKSKTEETLTNYGNCISASIALGLEQYINNNYKNDDKKILLLGAAAGVTIGAIVLTF